MPPKKSKAAALKKDKAAVKKKAKPETDSDSEEEEHVPKHHKSEDDSDVAESSKAEKSGKEAKAAGNGGKKVDKKVDGASNFTVLGEYSTLLNQTNVGDANNNKFYIIQVLQRTGGKGKKFACFTRWGRVGVDGQTQMPEFDDSTAAIKQFEAKFKDKTGSAWSTRKNFVKKAGQYDYVDLAEDGDDDGADAQPLGKLSEAQLNKAKGILDELLKEVKKKKKDTKQINELSGRYFSAMPTNIGFAQTKALTTQKEIKEKQQTVAFLLRMGFGETKTVERKKEGAGPLSGLMKTPVPKTLEEACAGVVDEYELEACMEEAEELHEERGKKKKLTKDETAAVALYTGEFGTEYKGRGSGESVYRAMNQALREEDELVIKVFWNYLRLLFEATNKLSAQPKKVFRGIGVDLSATYKPGAIITWMSVSSTTIERGVAESFAFGCGGGSTLLTIAAKRAIDISELSVFGNEKESLLMPGTMLKIKTAKKNKHVLEVEAEEVGNCVLG